MYLLIKEVTELWNWWDELFMAKGFQTSAPEKTGLKTLHTLAQTCAQLRQFELHIIGFGVANQYFEVEIIQP